MAVLERAGWKAGPVDAIFPARPASGIVLHHTDIPPGRAPVETMLLVQKIHAAAGFEDVGYHFVVMADGTIGEGRNGSWAAARRGEVVRGAHARNAYHNQHSFGVALDGNFLALRSWEDVPPAQRAATIQLLAALSSWAGLEPVSALVPHSAVRCPFHTECPGGLGRADVLTSIGLLVAAGLGDPTFEGLVQPPLLAGAPAGFTLVPVGRRVVGARWIVDDRAITLPAGGRSPAGETPEALTLPLLGDLARLDVTRIGYTNPTVVLAGALAPGSRPVEATVDGEAIVVALGDHPLRFELDGGRVRITVTGRLELRLEPGPTRATLRLVDGGSVEIAVDLAIRRHLHPDLGEWSSEHAPWAWTEPVPVEAVGGGVPTLTLGATVDGGTELLVAALSDLPGAVTLAPAVLSKLSVTAGPMSMGQLAIPLFDRAPAAPPGLTVGGGAKIQFEVDHLLVGPITLDIGGGLVFAGMLRLAPDLTVATDAMTLELGGGGFVHAGSALTLVLHAGTRWSCRFADAGPELVASSRRVATALAPAVDTATAQRLVADPDAEVDAAHFVLRVEQGLRLAAVGAFFRAFLEPRQMRIDGLARAVSVDGTLVVDGREWLLDLGSEFGLPWFEDARGTLRFSAGRGRETQASTTFSATLASVWTDPSGVLAVHAPQVRATVTVGPGGFQVEGAVSGRLELRAAALVGAAESWGKQLFSGLMIEFDALTFADLKALVEPDTKGLGRYPVRLRLASGVRCHVWEVFPFELTELRLGVGRRVQLVGDVAFSIGPVAFGGALPGLGFQLDPSGISLDLAGDGPVRLWGRIQLPSGLRAEATLNVRDEPGEQSLEGAGVVQIPGLGQVEIAFVIGRNLWDGKWHPTLALYADAPLVIAVYPGVVIKRLGLGFGVHRRLRGTADLAVLPVSALYAQLAAEGAPDPGRHEDWEVDQNTALQFVIRALVTATTSPPEAIDYYVAELVMAVDSRLSLQVFNEIWLLSSGAEVRDRGGALRDHPFARGVIMADIGAPALKAAWRTLPDARSSLAPDGAAARGLQSFVAGSETSLRMEAAPHRFEIVVGPRRFSERIGPLQLEATSTFAVRADRRGMAVAAAMGVYGEVGGHIGVDLGAAQVSFSATAGLRGELAMLGQLAEEGLLVFGQQTIAVWFKLDIHVRIGFSKRIRIGFVRVSISWHEDFHLGFGVSATVDVSCALSTRPEAALLAIASLRFQVFGFDVSVSLPKIGEGAEALLDRARAAKDRALVVSA